ncbi:MAG: hypothetical protein A3H51_01295 [Candidatus Spechtbacteria bacterium RIFCSPLOWO2_02_FULL_38_8]|uniref:Pyrroloquinoline quinone-dependent pyranose dehydrogenase beta-propeller domain-containing protein n=1 Tax=Candidatus Spechtbacteria bacterium RIFCSPLOWO2_02_FULL_38_8 TaxID=1802164 RepID=A0A1G2HFX6_9BACT|nr:MAG: hypothetical protein A3H51_01295 [Candidatus Spechtbacteria bacterium RIFCSPLOWO2_02_FULL_38_8]
MKKLFLAAAFFVLVVGLVATAIFLYKNFINKELESVLTKTDLQKFQKEFNIGELVLSLPEEFSIKLFAKDLPGARVIVQDEVGNFWVSQTSEGSVSLLEVKDGKVVNISQVFRNLNKPHGLAIDPQDGMVLYIAESDKISRVHLYSESGLEKLIDLPFGGGHFTRTLAFGPDDRLYVSIGSSCDTCIEQDERRAAIYSMERDGSDFKKFADGLRNTVFFDWHFVTGKMWGTDMGRDFLGDNLPPDEINIIEEGKFYGWPWCYGKNISDTKFDILNKAKEICATAEASYMDIQAHSAPLGLAFIPEEGWPQEYWYNLLVAYHGSWNKTKPTGYKIVRFKLDEEGNLGGHALTPRETSGQAGSSQEEDFITGWLSGQEIFGRPVDILIQVGGVMYITDDEAGAVYKVEYRIVK